MHVYVLGIRSHFEPIYFHLPDEQKVAVLVVDVEGKHFVRRCCLSILCLLCSFNLISMFVLLSGIGADCKTDEAAMRVSVAAASVGALDVFIVPNNPNSAMTYLSMLSRPLPNLLPRTRPSLPPRCLSALLLLYHDIDALSGWDEASTVQLFGSQDVGAIVKAAFLGLLHFLPSFSDLLFISVLSLSLFALRLLLKPLLLILLLVVVFALLFSLNRYCGFSYLASGRARSRSFIPVWWCSFTRTTATLFLGKGYAIFIRTYCFSSSIEA